MEGSPQLSDLWQAANNRTNLLFAFTPFAFFQPFRVPPMAGIMFMPQMVMYRSLFPFL